MYTLRCSCWTCFRTLSATRKCTRSDMLIASLSVLTSRSRSMRVAPWPCAASRSFNVRCMNELREKSAGSLATIVVAVTCVLLMFCSEYGTGWLVTMFTSKLWLRARVRSRLKSDDALHMHRTTFLQNYSTANGPAAKILKTNSIIKQPWKLVKSLIWIFLTLLLISTYKICVKL